MPAPSLPTDSAADTAAPELLPLIVGITGHRDLRSEDIASLQEAVRAILREVREHYPHTPLVILSPLGEGADRLVAGVALEEGARLLVPLPLPRALYERSFSNDDSRREFATLLEHAAAVFTLPWLDGVSRETKNSDIEATVTEIVATPAQIEGQYAGMGAYIARHSHIFLALWDGDDSPEHERTGGTAQVVRFRLHGAPPPYGPVLSALERGGYGAIHHVVTPRKSHSSPLKDAFSCHLLPSTESAENFSRIDVFNADVLKWQDTMEQSSRDNAQALVVGESGTDTDENQNTPFLTELKPLLNIYGWSDALSTYFARRMARTVRRIFILVFFAAFSFNLFHSIPHEQHGSGHESAVPSLENERGRTPKADSTAETAAETVAAHSETAGAAGHAPVTAASLWSLLPWFLWIYLGLVAFNVVVHQRAEKEELQNKYQDYRALAEGLRVQIFWRLAGLHDEVSDHYLSKQRGELNWIRNAIKSCNVMADAFSRENASKTEATHETARTNFRTSTNNSTKTEAIRLGLVVRQWAQEQRNYYVRKAHREQEGLEHQEKLIGFFLAASLGLALVLGLLLSLPAFLPLLEPVKGIIEQPFVHSFVMLTIVMLAIIAGLLHGYNQHLARAEHAKRYGRMGIMFQDACSELEAQLQAGHHHKMHAIVHELGREALVENGDWVLLHRERPLEVPHAG